MLGANCENCDFHNEHSYVTCELQIPYRTLYVICELRFPYWKPLCCILNMITLNTNIYFPIHFNSWRQGCSLTPLGHHCTHPSMRFSLAIYRSAYDVEGSLLTHPHHLPPALGLSGWNALLIGCLLRGFTSHACTQFHTHTWMRHHFAASRTLRPSRWNQ